MRKDQSNMRLFLFEIFFCLVKIMDRFGKVLLVKGVLLKFLVYTRTGQTNEAEQPKAVSSPPSRLWQRHMGVCVCACVRYPRVARVTFAWLAVPHL